jgi:hypothetical protein
MKKILIVYPHFPPSNLAGVHRPRLFAQHLPAFGWEPTILTVDEKYYEEVPDWNLVKLLPASLKIEKVPAFKLTNPRLVGDIGLRAFFQLYKKAKEIIQSQAIDFLYIPIPSFYTALLGRWLNKSTGVPYGIDYIDPWVHEFPGSDRLFSRHWFSTKFARFLEPIALKNAALITGVAEGYYSDVLRRNPHLLQRAASGAMPYGGETTDYDNLPARETSPYLFKKDNSKVQMVYAGELLPRAREPLLMMFESIASDKAAFSEIQFHFIGTGKKAGDASGFNIKSLAEQYGLWQTIIFEYPQRIPYLDVLVHLEIADGIFILGSTEPHYTPSKTYQAVLSGKPVFAVLHSDSSAVNMIRRSGAGFVLDFKGDEGINTIKEKFATGFMKFAANISKFDPATVDRSFFEEYSAKNITRQLALLLDRSIKIK